MPFLLIKIFLLLTENHSQVSSVLSYLYEQSSYLEDHGTD